MKLNLVVDEIVKEICRMIDSGELMREKNDAAEGFEKIKLVAENVQAMPSDMRSGIMKRDEKGAISIETLISLPFFMIGILAIMSMASIVRVQATMQYAISQTAKEISGYYYLLDKIGLASVTTGQIPEKTKENLEHLDSTLASFSTLSSDFTYTADEFKNMEGMSVQEIMDFSSENAEKMENDARELGNHFKNMVSDDPVSQMKAVLQLFGKTMINKLFSQCVAPYVCQALVPKYLSDGKDVEEYCESLGLNWNGEKGIDEEYVCFKGSELLDDGRSIRISVEYTLNTKKMTFGIVDTVLVFRQTASTAAWIRPEENSSKVKIKDLPVPPELKESSSEGE